jgi:hypothetical protein
MYQASLFCRSSPARTGRTAINRRTAGSAARMRRARGSAVASGRASSRRFTCQRSREQAQYAAWISLRGGRCSETRTATAM